MPGVNIIDLLRWFGADLREVFEHTPGDGPIPEGVASRILAVYDRADVPLDVIAEVTKFVESCTDWSAADRAAFARKGFMLRDIAPLTPGQRRLFGEKQDIRLPTLEDVLDGGGESLDFNQVMKLILIERFGGDTIEMGRAVGVPPRYIKMYAGDGGILPRKNIEVENIAVSLGLDPQRLGFSWVLSKFKRARYTMIDLALPSSVARLQRRAENLIYASVLLLDVEPERVSTNGGPFTVGSAAKMATVARKAGFVMEDVFRVMGDMIAEIPAFITKDIFDEVAQLAFDTRPETASAAFHFAGFYFAKRHDYPNAALMEACAGDTLGEEYFETIEETIENNMTRLHIYMLMSSNHAEARKRRRPAATELVASEEAERIIKRARERMERIFYPREFAQPVIITSAEDDGDKGGGETPQGNGADGSGSSGQAPGAPPAVSQGKAAQSRMFIEVPAVPDDEAGADDLDEAGFGGGTYRASAFRGARAFMGRAATEHSAGALGRSMLRNGIPIRFK